MRLWRFCSAIPLHEGNQYKGKSGDKESGRPTCSNTVVRLKYSAEAGIENGFPDRKTQSIFHSSVEIFNRGSKLIKPLSMRKAASNFPSIPGFSFVEIANSEFRG
jgi:hypothetical protein